MDHLWRQVVKRATDCLAPIRWSVHAPPEVSEFYLAILIEQVLRLNISVDDVLRVHVLQSSDDLCNVPTSRGLVVSALWLGPQVVEKFTLVAILQY